MSSAHSNPKELARHLHEQIWDAGNLDLIDQLVAEDYLEHSTAHAEDLRGRGPYRASIEELRRAFPDLSASIEDTVAEGDKVSSRLTFRGTHEGPFQDLDPTGQSVAFEVMVINRFEDGRLAEAWVQSDLMGLMQQLGAI